MKLTIFDVTNDRKDWAAPTIEKRLVVFIDSPNDLSDPLIEQIAGAVAQVCANNKVGKTASPLAIRVESNLGKHDIES